jgi:outer membrane receptor protein involved in Fe transport
VKYFTVADFIKRNLYFNPGMTDNLFLEYKTDINGMLKYEYEKLFTISLTGGYAKLSNYFYFDDAVNPGKFDLNILPEAKILSSGFNLIFYPARYGHFLGEFIYRNVEDQFGSLVPYEPKISASLTYGYNFDIGLDFRVRYYLAYNVYTNMVTADKLNDYHDVSLSLKYEIISGLKLTADFQNILNRTNFVWKQYQEKPFDVLLGIEYRW